jgi:hypothetical protein
MEPRRPLHQSQLKISVFPYRLISIIQSHRSNDVSPNMFRPTISIIYAFAITLFANAAPVIQEAANLSAIPANQLTVAGNACGPTALLNTFHFGNADWQRVYYRIKGTTDKERIYTIIREIGMRPSKHLAGRPRWSRKGVNIADLGDMANELTIGEMLPPISSEVLFGKQGESQETLLARVHNQLGVSLKKGLPPILSLRRYVLRNSQWTIIGAHFVTVISIPQKLETGACSFQITYVDPWGGKILIGEIAIPTQPSLSNSANTSPCLNAIFPHSSVGKTLLRPDEHSVLTLSAALGRW